MERWLQYRESYDTDIRIQNHIHRYTFLLAEVCVEYYSAYIANFSFINTQVGLVVKDDSRYCKSLSSNALHSLLFPLPPLQ